MFVINNITKWWWDDQNGKKVISYLWYKSKLPWKFYHTDMFWLLSSMLDYKGKTWEKGRSSVNYNVKMDVTTQETIRYEKNYNEILAWHLLKKRWQKSVEVV